MVHAIRRLAGVSAVFSLMLMGFLAVPGVRAGTTGKIAGRVTDQNGAGLPGVAVTLEGTRLGATTDADGRYMILQVPPGVHNVTANLIGYRRSSITSVNVSADRTTDVNFRLTEATIEVGAIVVRAERPPIEVDVTSSQTVVNAARISEAPVSRMLDFLNYEPGVSVTRGTELEIRGGGPSEIRFQVDGLDRTDGLTSKPYTQLNQVLVSEVTLLTGGFNAEYGNVRSGMVNVVNKDGTERRSAAVALPWVSGVYNMAPARKKHFGPGGYDSDQYDYWLMSSDSPFADSALAGPLYWPLLYEETRTAPEFTDPTNPKYVNPRTSAFRVFDGWKQRATVVNAARGWFGKRDWTPAEVREAWEWEANMNEQVWKYSNNPDYNLDLAAGWALPKRMGGVVVGYSRTYEMTVVPALRPYNEDQTFEAKFTLTPLDKIKIQFSYMTGRNEGTAAGSTGGAASNPELAASGASVTGNDPVMLRASGDLLNGLTGTSDNTKFNLSYNSLLNGEYSQYGGTFTYTFSPKTFLSASLGRSSSKWEVNRDLPRADFSDFAPGGRYQPPNTWSGQGWMGFAFGWTDTNGVGGPDKPSSLADALNPNRLAPVSPFGIPYLYYQVPSEAKFIYREIGGDTTTVGRVVSPQGYVMSAYKDLSGVYGIGGGGHVRLTGRSNQIVFRSDFTHAMGSHTLKTGVEFIRGDLEYHMIQNSALTTNTEWRDYGGNYPAVNPSILGVYLQDKFETNGMIANGGIRIERFDAGQNAYFYNDMFDNDLFVNHGTRYFKDLSVALGWDTLAYGPVPVNNVSDYFKVKEKLGVAPEPWDVVRIFPQSDNIVHWRIAPRFGISHPVSYRTKFFFNYGIFYSMQKAAVMYGHSDHDGRAAFNGWVADMFNPNLRPAKTTMYEVGVEHVFPLGLVMTVRGYAKYNVDQVTRISVTNTLRSDFRGYSIFRNANYEDIQGAEIKISRSSGRFVNGWLTYQKTSSRSGMVGLTVVDLNTVNIQPFESFASTSDPKGYFQGMLRVGTPMDWGNIRGGWAVSVVQSYASGGEVIYNPEALPRREIPDENILPSASSYNTDLKLSKAFQLGRGRSLSAYLDIGNVFNIKRLNGGGIQNYIDYLGYIYGQRLQGNDMKVGDESTFAMFTRPWKDKDGNWKRPTSAQTEWMHHLYPRSYRVGVRFDL